MRKEEQNLRFRERKRAFISSLVLRANSIVRETYQFIRLYFLKYPETTSINRSFLKKVFSIVSYRKKINSHSELDIFYEQVYSSLQLEKQDGKKIKDILDAEIVQILTNISNHITTTFYDQVNALIASQKPDKPHVKNLRNDLWKNTLTSPSQYHLFLKEWSSQLVDAQKKIKDNPQAALPFLFKINQYLESKGLSTFALIPLRTSLIPCYITLGPHILSQTFPNSEGLWKEWEDKTKELMNIKTDFRLSSLKTDGIGCSLFFKHITRKWGKKKRRKEFEQYIDHLSNFEDIKGKKVVAIDPNKGNLVYCFDGEKTFRYTQNQRRKETKKTKYKKIRKKKESEKMIRLEDDEEFHSIQDDINKLRETPKKTVDWKKFCSYILSKNKFAQRFQDVYNQSIFRKLRFNTKINTTRSEDKFLERFEKTFGSPKEVIISFGDWEQMKGISYGKEPTKGKSLRKMFRKKGYTVYLKDEYRTSMICEKCKKGENDQFQKRKDPRPWKQGKTQRVWGLVRCKTCSTVHQRDFNSASNILFLTNCLIEEKEIPSIFKRT